MPDIVTSRLDQLAHEAYRAFVDSDETTVIAIALGEVHHFTDRQGEVLENAIVLYLLCLLDEQTLSTFIEHQCELTTDAARVLSAAITLALPVDIRAARQNPETLFNPPHSAIPQNVAETITAPGHVEPVRTMARDMHDLESQDPVETPVYRSEQPSVVNPAPTFTPPPPQRQ